MRLTIHDQKEFTAGLIFAVVGMGWAAASFRYPIGHATEMGPGYFPLIVGIVLMLLGICSVVRAIRTEQTERLQKWKIAPLFFILGGVAFFALSLERFGLVFSAIGLVVISSYKRTLSRPFEVAIVAVATATFVSVLFVYVLQLGFDLF